MGTWVVIAGWGIALILAAAAVSSAARVRGQWRDPGAWAVPLPFACLAVTALTVLGVLAPLTGAVAAAILAAAEGVFLWRGDKPLYAFAGHLGGGFRHLYADARSLASRSLASRARPGEPGKDARPAPAPAPAAAPAQGPPAAAREVPPLREDEALAPVPHPAEVATGLAEAGVEVPEPYRVLADWIAGQDPETDDDQSRFLHGCAAGKIAVAEAWQAHGENMVNGVGLDPSYGAAVFDMADSEAATASDAVLVHRRYHVIYGEIKQAVENGLVLPHRPRQWFGGGAAPQDSPGESAA
jgi:hypothetical protein